jgi:hypothetical protein
MPTYVAPNRTAVPPSFAVLVRRAKIVLTASALVASILVIAVGAWPLKILVALAFVRGMFASDVIALRNAPRRRGRAYERHTRGGPARIDDQAGGSLAGKLSIDASSTASGGSSRLGWRAPASSEDVSTDRRAISARSSFVTIVPPVDQVNVVPGTRQRQSVAA